MKNTILYRMIYNMCVLHEPMIITVHFTGMEIISCLVVLPNARRASDRFVHCVLGVKWGGGHVAAPFVPMVVALVLNFLCTQYYSLREGG